MNIWKTTTPPTNIPEMTPQEPIATVAINPIIIPQKNGGIIDRIQASFNHSLEKIQANACKLVDNVKSLAGRVKEFAISLIDDMNFEVTKTKIEQVMLTGFAIYTGLAAKIIAGGLIPATFLQWTAAAPLVAVSGISIWYATNLVDYDSPEKLERIRKKAQKLPLAEVILQNGWQNVFMHQILSPSQFQDAFRNLANTRTFKELFILAKEATLELATANSSSIGTKFQIPQLVEWKDVFLYETSQLELSEILAEYPLHDLQALNALNPEELKIFEKAQLLLDELKHEKEIVRKKLSDYIDQAGRTVSKIDVAFGPTGSLEEELQILSDAFDKVRTETIDNHQKRLGEIGKELSEITVSYNELRSSRPINA